MVEQALYSTLGFLVAALFFLALVPLLQRRAERLTRRRLESRMPFTFEQIDAQQSMLLARCAVSQRRFEQKLESLEAARTQAMMEAGRRLFEVQTLREQFEASSRSVARLENEAAERARDLADVKRRLEATQSALEALKLEKSAFAREHEILCARLEVYESRHATEPDAAAIAAARAEREPSGTPAMIGGWDDWADQAALEPLDRGDAFAFLRRRAGERGEAGAAAIIEVLGSTPLSLELAAAHCRRLGTPFSTYAADAGLLMASTPGRGSSAGLAAAFALSVGAARGLSSAAERLVAFLGLCAGERAPWLLVEGVSRDPAEARSATCALTDLALATPASFADGVPALLMRQPLHELARERAQQMTDGEAVAESLLRRLSEIYPTDAFGNPESRSLCAKLTPHVVEICATKRLQSAFNETRADLKVRAGDYLLAEGDHAGAAALFQSALSIRESLFGPSHPETAASLDTLAAARCAQGDFAGAHALLERSRKIFETGFGLDYLATGRRQVLCARMLLKLGRPREALALAEAALARLRADGRSRHPWTIDAAFVVVEALEALGKKRRAASLRREFSGAPVSEPAQGGGLADRLLERLHGLVWGGYAARNHR
ncbi:tetratricopeptide repeat protein [Methylocystis bryophila]|uniref:MalT-like TPR region domain-containing protein n=1 Tax=Methylocystis bryophila TaxID=655015 RepID=A0A1W6MTJ7_9HYPH|nr:tetratricopeptide repeat protein [Methylocystis bryophila]ARN80897.1 hypothetical protein B1812_07195 [Methylocystis bryophila]BDV36787.1 hypothetical protein DSM21852_00400 [Methylocystis bryophila]